MSDLRWLDTRRTKSSSWWWIIVAIIIVVVIVLVVIYLFGSKSKGTAPFERVSALHQMTSGAVSSSLPYPAGSVEFVDTDTGQRVSSSLVENGEYAPV